MFSRKIAIDLGTANTIVHLQGKGIIADEPSVVAISEDNKIIAIGKEAKTMMGKTPDIITAHRPLQNGVIADYRVTEAMLKYFINKAIGSYITNFNTQTVIIQRKHHYEKISKGSTCT